MLSQQIKWILENINAHQKDETSVDNRGDLISVNNLTGKAGVFYEKLRYLVDYKEEHTIRRSAIERVLKRKLIIEGDKKIGLSLLQELVGGGYIINKKIPEGVARDIQSIINKYLILGSDKVGYSQLANIMASEIERFLYPQYINDLVTESFYKTILDHIKYTGTVSNSELRMQTYIACRRSLLEDDHDTLIYAVLVKYIPELPTLNNKDHIADLTTSFATVLSSIEEKLKNPLGWKMSLKFKNHSVYFSVIREIVKKYGVLSEMIFTDPVRLEEEIKEFLNEKYQQQYHSINKSSNRAIAYIFLTKIILALVLELPYEKFFLFSVDYLALGTNIIFHPLLFLIMVKNIKLPSSNNTNLVISGVRSVIQNEKIEPIRIKSQVNNTFFLSIFNLFYLVLFGVSFGLIIWILNLLHFNVVSIILFLFFLTLISYLGFRIRHNAKKWNISIEDDNIFSLLFDFFTIPIMTTGSWLSRRFSSINIFVFTMDFILETPFKLILGTFDSFISFLKEKKDDL